MVTNTNAIDRRSYLSNLNSAQHEAVISRASNLLLIAGAGSGKTRVLTCRIAFLINDLKIKPWQILGVTFTNKAAAEMKERTLLLSAEASDTQLRTFHSFGAYFLRRYASEVGLKSSFSIYDDDQVLTVMKGEFIGESPSRLKQLRNYFSTAKNLGFDDADDWEKIDTTNNIKDLFYRYQRAMSINNALDFDDLIYQPLMALRHYPLLLSNIQGRYRAILVDEYQDTNYSQVALLRLLVGSTCMITAVGDEDQSIYRFRGAEPANILDFPHNFSPATILKLEQNYRSTGHILMCANELIKNNKGRIGKNLFTNSGDGIMPSLYIFDYSDEEAAFCVDLLTDKAHIQTAILYRTNAQSRIFETFFMKHNIAYRLLGSVRFYQREEIKTAVSLLTLLYNPYDEDAFMRIINRPARGIGKKALSIIMNKRTITKGDYLLAMHLSVDELKGKPAKGTNIFLALIEELKTSLAGKNLSQLMIEALDRSGLRSYYEQIDDNDGTSRSENLSELVSALQPYGMGLDALGNFLEDTSLDSGNEQLEEDEPNRVTLTTIHNTKGLEFERVIVTGMEENLFPKIDTFSLEDEDELEEERRLFYVAITRARKQLYFTASKKRLVYGKIVYNAPSRFLRELPSSEYEVITNNLDAEDSVSLRYSEGSYVRHDEYGVGRIASKKIIEGRLVVDVVFTGGRKAKFLPEFSYLEPISPFELD